MADNYLENKMEEHRRGVQSAPRRIFPSGNRPGHIDIAIPPLKLLIVGDATPLTEAIARSFIETGCKVAVGGVDSESTTLMTRRAGARFYPLSRLSADEISAIMSDMVYHWHGIDILIGVGIDVSVYISELSRIRAANPLSSEYVVRLINLMDKPFSISTESGVAVFNIPAAGDGCKALAQIALICASDAALALLKR